MERESAALLRIVHVIKSAKKMATHYHITVGIQLIAEQTLTVHASRLRQTAVAPACG